MPAFSFLHWIGGMNTKLLILPLIVVAGVLILILIGPESPDKERQEITTASGLKYIDQKIGTGKEAKPRDTVVVHYTGWLQDGTKFDSSRDSGEPAEMSLNRVIQGWKEGIPGMKV